MLSRKIALRTTAPEGERVSRRTRKKGRLTGVAAGGVGVEGRVVGAEGRGHGHGGEGGGEG